MLSTLPTASKTYSKASSSATLSALVSKVDATLVTKVASGVADPITCLVKEAMALTSVPEEFILSSTLNA